MMSDRIPRQTIEAFAKTIYAEAKNYGFRQLDVVQLINALIDQSTEDKADAPPKSRRDDGGESTFVVDSFPLRSERLRIRIADQPGDGDLLRGWMRDQYGRHFLLSSATAQAMEVDGLLDNPRNSVGIVLDDSGQPIGAVAFLDIDHNQKRAELRKLIGEPSARGKGLAEEATRLWIQYGGQVLGLEKIYVSTLQTHLRNIRLNESIGFRVEGLLQREVLISGERHDVLRMGLCFDEFRPSGD